MKKVIAPVCVFLFICCSLCAQKIIPIEYNGKKYEVLDMTSKGKIAWGGYSEQVNGVAKSQTDGEDNTNAIVIAVSKNPAFDNKPYAAKICSDASDGNRTDWYLPAKDEADAIYAFKDKFKVEERGSIWTSSEVNGTQALTKYWYSGSFYNSAKVDQYQFVCIRKVE